MDSLLQLYYMGMAVYGWLCWRNVHSYSAVRVVDAEDLPSAAKITRDKCTSPNIQTWSLTAHLKIIIALSVLSFGLGSFMAHFTPADFPYFDATTTVFAVFATYMVTKKVLENWLYWVVIDFLSIYIYIEKGLTPTAVLFALYVILALYGYIKWQQTYRQQQTVSYA
jgi:nicotinamide mononucleotide transporter